MSSGLINCLLVFLGGGTGALTRFGVQSLNLFEHDKYYYTLIINLTGCFIIGAVYAALEHFNASRAWSLLLMTGFLGGYTTYSAYTLDLIQLFLSGRPGMGFIYCGLTIFGAMGACLAALWLTRRFFTII